MTTSQSRLARQIAEAITAMERINAEFALIGGLALASHKVVRATQDVDLLVDSEMADAIAAELISLGYRTIHRSADAANYLRGDERLDLLYASRPIAKNLLAGVREVSTSLGKLRVVSGEGLIGLKLQARSPLRHPSQPREGCPRRRPIAPIPTRRWTT